MPIAPTIRKAIVEDNNVRPEYGRIRVPVLAVYRTTTLQQALREFPPRNDAERAALEFAVGPGQRARLAKWGGANRSRRPDSAATKHHSRAGDGPRLALSGDAKEGTVLYYALVFLIVGLIASALGAYGVAAVASQIAWVLFVIAIVLLIVHMVSTRRRVL